MSHNYFCPLNIVYVSPTFLVFDKYTHLFSLTREWKIGEYLIPLLHPVPIPYLHTQSIPLNQFRVHLIRKLDQCYLIGTARLKYRLIHLRFH
jgi:hypothetical protein